MMIANEADLAEALATARQPVRVRGGGTRDIGAPVAGDPLEVKIAGVELYEPGALTLVARAGTPLAEVEALLAGEGQRLAFEPMDHRALLGTEGEPTIGGMVAANVSGPRRIQAGAARDFALGARFVDGSGRIIKNGGRVMKNVTGYDLVKLMAGSWGTLGVLTEASFKVQAVPEAEATLVGRGLALAEAVAALARALGSPYDVTGAAHLDLDDRRTLVRIEGLESMVAYRAGALQAQGFAGWDLVQGAASAALWREVRDVVPFAGSDAPVWRVSVKPSDAPKLSQALTAQGLTHRGIYDWGGGLAWLEMSQAGTDAGAAALRAALAPLGGHATLVRAAPELRARVDVFQPQPAPLAAISRGLKQKFDPRGILNPGLMGA
jgi:glycolate dehydrogenase FAD-binding subunit